MRIIRAFIALSLPIAVTLSGCAAMHPQVYPNEQYQKVGAAVTDEDIADCEAKAQEYVKTGGQGSQMAGETARKGGCHPEPSGEGSRSFW